MRILTLFAVTLALVLFSACNSTPKEDPSSGSNPESQQTADFTWIEPSADYPLDTCVVSGEGLDEMTGPLATTYHGTEVQFCCEKCMDEFKKDPETYVAKVKAARGE